MSKQGVRDGERVAGVGLVYSFGNEVLDERLGEKAREGVMCSAELDDEAFPTSHNQARHALAGASWQQSF